MGKVNAERQCRENIKVTFIADQMRSGGAERVVANLSSEFVTLGCTVSIIMLNETSNHCEYPVDSEVKLIPVKRIYHGNNPIQKILLLRKCVKENDPDVLISFQNHAHVYAYCASLGLNIPHIVSERSDPGQYPKDRITRVLRRYIFRKASGCVFQTDGARSFFSGEIQRKSEVIPNPVVLMYEPQKLIHREKKITAAGGLTAPKNYDMMVRAFALFSERNPGYKLIICGEGNLRGDIEKLIDELSLTDSVVLKGQVCNPHEEIFDSSVFVLSSDFEGMPNSLLEAMALGVPVVSTDCPCGGPSEVIKNNENGILVPTGDIKAMAEAIEAIIRNKEFSDRLSEKAQRVRQEFSLPIIAERWLVYIGGIIIKPSESITG